jgi:hypothetical protein
MHGKFRIWIETILDSSMSLFNLLFIFILELCVMSALVYIKYIRAVDSNCSSFQM